VKIGYAKDPADRLSELQVGSPAPLKLLGCVAVKSERHARNVERAVHALFAFCRKRGEWFSADATLRGFPAACEAFGLEQAYLLAREFTKKKAHRANRRKQSR
jgi:hypothetical protein